MISVNLRQHDLRVGTETGTSTSLEASPKPGRGGRARNRAPMNGNGNGDSFPRQTLAAKFKNPDFTVSDAEREREGQRDAF